MFPSFLKCASEMLSKWEEIVATEGYSEVNIWPYLQTLSSDAISRTAFGSNYEEGRRIFELQREQILYCRKGSLRIPGWRYGYLPYLIKEKKKKKHEKHILFVICKKRPCWAILSFKVSIFRISPNIIWD